MTQDPQVTGYPDSRKLVRDRAGNLYAAYRKKGLDQAYHIFVATLPHNSQHWQSPMQIEQVGAFNQRVPALAIDSHDTLHVAWYGLHAASQGKHDRQIYYSRGKRGPTGQLLWAAPIMPAGVVAGYATVQPEPTLWQEHPVIHATVTGQLYIAWEGKDQTNAKKAQIKLVRSLDGGASWTPWRNLPGTPGTYYSRPTLVASGDGQTLYCLAYATGPTRQVRLVWTQLHLAGNVLAEDWQPWREVVPVDEQDQRHVSVVVDAAEQLHAVWQQKMPQHTDGTQIGYASFRAGQWSAPSYPVAQLGAFQTFPSLTTDPSGQLWLAWNEFPHEPDLHGEEVVGGNLGVAYKPPAEPWQSIDISQLIPSHTALYPSLRWQRRYDHAAIDLIWTETSQSTPTNATQGLVSQAKQPAPRYCIRHINLTGDIVVHDGANEPRVGQ